MSAPIQLPLDLPEIDAEVAGGARLRRSILPSGVRLITEDVPGAASAAIGCFVPLGSRDETETEYGSSHFLEHLLFKGTPTRSAREVALEFDRVGGDFNAATSREQTVYHARVRDHDLPMAIEVLADMLTSSLIDPVEFETERGVILEEIASAGDDPIDVLWERFYATHFDGHPLGRPLAGVFYHNAQDILSLVSLSVRLCRLLEDPLDAGVSAMEKLGVARMCEDAGRIDESARAYQAALAGLLDRSVAWDARRRLSLMLKRAGRRDEAVDIWRAMLDSGNSSDLFPFVELAKHYEWHTLDLQEALSIVLRAREHVSRGRFSWQRQQAAQELEHRMSRLQRKLAGDMPATAGETGEEREE